MSSWTCQIIITKKKKKKKNILFFFLNKKKKRYQSYVFKRVGRVTPNTGIFFFRPNIFSRDLSNEIIGVHKITYFLQVTRSRTLLSTTYISRYMQSRAMHLIMPRENIFSVTSAYCSGFRHECRETHLARQTMLHAFSRTPVNINICNKTKLELVEINVYTIYDTYIYRDTVFIVLSTSLQTIAEVR